MFKNYAYLRFDPENCFVIKIIDDDFEEDIAALSIDRAIIFIYERRKLNVAKNLIIYYKFLAYNNIKLINSYINNCSIEKYK